MSQPNTLIFSTQFTGIKKSDVSRQPISKNKLLKN